MDLKALTVETLTASLRRVINEEVNQRIDRLETQMTQRIDRLEENLQSEIGKVNQRIDRLEARVDERFDRMDQRFAQIDQRFDRVDERFNRVDQRFDRVDERFNRAETKVDEQARDIKDIRDAVVAVGDNIPAPGIFGPRRKQENPAIGILMTREEEPGYPAPRPDAPSP